jgi:hypothetical protein
MRFRNLRIAWSVVWGLACLLMIALWVRSNWQWDQLYNPITNKHLIIVESASGRVILVTTAAVPGSPWSWHISQELRGKYWGGPLGDFQETNRHEGFGGFAYYATPWNTTYRVPDWIPWFRWSNRFSLRTLLIATTLVAMVLGIIVYAVRN